MAWQRDLLISSCCFWLWTTKQFLHPSGGCTCSHQIIHKYTYIKSIKINSRSKTYSFSSTYLKDYHASDIFWWSVCNVLFVALLQPHALSIIDAKSHQSLNRLSDFQHLKKTSLVSHHSCVVGRMTRGWHSSNSSKMVVNRMFLYEAVWISHSKSRAV